MNVSVLILLLVILLVSLMVVPLIWTQYCGPVLRSRASAAEAKKAEGGEAEGENAA